MTDKKPRPAVPQFTIPDWLRVHVAEVRAWGPVAGEHSVCWVVGCERSPHLHGLCRRHYFRAADAWKRSGPRNTSPEPPSDLETDRNDAPGRSNS